MPDFPSFQDLFRIARDEALIRNKYLSRTAIEREGSDNNIIFAGASAVGDEVIHQLTLVAAASFLDSAIGTDLDRLVFDRYSLTRKSAAPAVGSVSFSTTILNPAPFAIPVGTSLASANGTQYATTEAVIFPAASVGPIVAAVRSVLAGEGQEAKPNTITNILSSITGSPADLVVTNPLATAGNSPDESDTSLRERARQFFPTVRRGTLAALEAKALEVPGVESASAIEVIDTQGRPARLVQLVVSDKFLEVFAELGSIPPSYPAQSQVLAATVFAALDDTRAAGIYVQVIVALVILQAIQLALTFSAGVDVNQVAEQARAVIVSTVNVTPPGQTLYRETLLSALRKVPGLVVTGAEIASPAGDVAPRVTEVLRTSMALVTAGLATGQPLFTTGNPDAYIVG